MGASFRVGRGWVLITEFINCTLVFKTGMMLLKLNTWRSQKMFLYLAGHKLHVDGLLMCIYNALHMQHYIASKLTQVFRDLAGLVPLESQILPDGNPVWLQRMHEKFCFPEVSKEQEGPAWTLFTVSSCSERSLVWPLLPCHIVITHLPLWSWLFLSYRHSFWTDILQQSMLMLALQKPISKLLPPGVVCTCWELVFILTGASQNQK